MAKAKKRPTSEKYDVLDKAAALALMTSEAANKRSAKSVPISTVVEDTKSWSGLNSSYKEVFRRIMSWVMKGWALVTNNSLTLTKTGRYHLGRIALAAV